MRNFYDYLTEISKGMGAGLVRTGKKDRSSLHRWENIVEEARDAGAQSAI